MHTLPRVSILCFFFFFFFFHIMNHLNNLYVKFNIIYAPSLGRLWYNQSCIHLSSLIRDVAFLISSTRQTTYSSTHLLPYCRFLLLVVEQLCSGLIVLTVARNTYLWKPVLTFISSIRTLINKRCFSLKWLWEIYIFHAQSQFRHRGLIIAFTNSKIISFLLYSRN